MDFKWPSGKEVSNQVNKLFGWKYMLVSFVLGGLFVTMVFALPFVGLKGMFELGVGRHTIELPPTCELPTGELPTGEIPTGELPTCELPTWEIPTWEIPTWEIPTWEIPTWELPGQECNVDNCDLMAEIESLQNHVAALKILLYEVIDQLDEME
jgi:hypothetical protein